MGKTSGYPQVFPHGDSERSREVFALSPTSEIRERHLHDAGAELLAQVNELPEPVRSRFLQEMMEAVLAFESTGDETALVRAVKALRISLQMNRTDYPEAARAAEAFTGTPTVDVAEYLSQQHERRTGT